jgi:hypothetical protein
MCVLPITMILAGHEPPFRQNEGSYTQIPYRIIFCHRKAQGLPGNSHPKYDTRISVV